MGFLSFLCRGSLNPRNTFEGISPVQCFIFYPTSDSSFGATKTLGSSSLAQNSGRGSDDDSLFGDLDGPFSTAAQRRSDAHCRSHRPDRLAGQPPYMVVYLKIQEDVVTAASFQTFGCGPAIAAGSLLTELVTGRTLQDCEKINADAVNQALGGLPPDKAWCADIAASAL